VCPIGEGVEELVKKARMGTLVGEGGLRLMVAAIYFDWRPAGADWKGRRGQPLELPSPVDHLAADESEDRLDAFNFLLGDREIVRGQHREVCQLAHVDAAFLVLLA
jgi:hypothetical protein